MRSEAARLSASLDEFSIIFSRLVILAGKGEQLIAPTTSLKEIKKLNEICSKEQLYFPDRFFCIRDLLWLLKSSLWEYFKRYLSVTDPVKGIRCGRCYRCSFKTA